MSSKFDHYVQLTAGNGRRSLADASPLALCALIFVLCLLGYMALWLNANRIDTQVYAKPTVEDEAAADEWPTPIPEQPTALPVVENLPAMGPTVAIIAPYVADSPSAPTAATVLPTEGPTATVTPYEWTIITLSVGADHKMVSINGVVLKVYMRDNAAVCEGITNGQPNGLSGVCPNGISYP